MNDAVRAFIEDNITLIESGDFIKVYDKVYYDMYDNQFARELTKVFRAADLDIEDCREDRLYNMLEGFCDSALTDGENNLHRLLDNENNWYGYSIHDVIDFFEQLQYNLGVKLIPVDDRIFRAPNYIIVENN